jgi:hypothetical protein
MVQERVAQGMTILEERSFLAEERWRLVPA